MAEQQTFLTFRKRKGAAAPQQHQKPPALSAEEFARLAEPEEKTPPVSPDQLQKVARAEESNREAEAEYLKAMHPHKP